MVHPRFGLHPPSKGIDCLIIQIMEIYNNFTHTSHSFSASTGINEFIEIHGYIRTDY